MRKKISDAQSFLNEKIYTKAFCMAFLVEFIYFIILHKYIHTCTKHKTIIYSENCVMNAFMMQTQR